MLIKIETHYYSNRLRRSKKVESFYANEVVLCGGAINTPQVLQLSGVGPADVLQAAGVECKLHSPGVGANLLGKNLHNICKKIAKYLSRF